MRLLILSILILTAKIADASAKVVNPAIKITAFSDINVDTAGNYNSATKKAIAQMVRSQPQVILGVGDYIDGEKSSLSSATYARMWSAFSSAILKPILSAEIPFVPSPGNHDAYYSHERAHYKSFWQKNQASVEYVDDRNYPFYYSYKKSGVFFVSLDDARYGTLYNRTTQLNWLRQQLQSKTAKAARARIVYGHIPLYSIAATRANSSTVYQNGALVKERIRSSSFSLEAILLDNQVDLVIFGHSHAYYGGEYVYPDGRELKVISLPCAGGSQRYLVGTSIKSRYGYVEIELSNLNQLSYQYFDYQGVAQSSLALPASLLLDSASRVKYFKK